MNKGEVRLIQADIAFWALLILSEVQTGWVSTATAVMAIATLVISYLLDNALYPREPGSGFWSRVWKR